METKIIEIATERTIEQNLALIGVQYFEEFNKHKLPIIGTIDEQAKKLILIVDESVQEELMKVVNFMNQRSQSVIT